MKEIKTKLFFVRRNPDGTLEPRKAKEDFSPEEFLQVQEKVKENILDAFGLELKPEYKNKVV